MPIVEFTQISLGRDSNVFKRFKLKKEEMHREQLSFTIHSKTRTLDLEAQSKNELDSFVIMLKIVMDYVQAEEQMKAFTTEE